jgi:hypothetical protein
MSYRRAMEFGGAVVLLAALVLAAKGMTNRSTPLVAVGIVLLIASRARRKTW